MTSALAVVDSVGNAVSIPGEWPTIVPGSGFDRVVSLRDLAIIESVSLMRAAYLKRLLEGVSLQGDPKTRPYLGCKVDLITVEPKLLKVGQRFVQKDKYELFVEKFPQKFSEFYLDREIFGYMPYIVSGRTSDGRSAISYYLPPIVEVHHGVLCALDGTHRNWHTRETSHSIKSVIIYDVKVPFPCGLHPWDDIQKVEKKPPLSERYFDLKPDLFRNLKAVGIDG